MVMGVVLARLLLPEDFGKFVYISAVVSALMIPFAITVTPLLVTDGGQQPDLFKDVLGFTVLITAIKLFILFLFILYMLVNSQYQQALLAFLIGFPVAFSDLPEALRADLEGQGRFAPNLAVQLAGLSTHAAVSISLVALGWGVLGLALGCFVAYWPQAYLYLLFSGRSLKQARFWRTRIYTLLKKGISFWMMQLSSNMSARIDKIFLGHIGGDVQLGYYNRALNYAPFCMFLLSSLLTNATVVAIRKKKLASEKLSIVKKTCLLLFVGALVNWAALWFFSDPVVPWLFGEQWRGAVPTFQAFSWLGLATAIQYIPINFLMAHEAHIQVAIGKTIGLVVLVIALAFLWLLGKSSAITVAYAFSGGMVVAGLAMFFMSRRILFAKKFNN